MRSWSVAAFAQWPKQADGLPSLEELDDATRQALLFVGGCHPDGRFRQAILAEGELWPGRLTLSLALIRANDWVAPVRLAVQGVVMHLLEHCDEQAVLGAWPLVLRLLDSERVDAQWIQRGPLEWLQQPGRRNLLDALLHSNCPRTRVWAHAIAFTLDESWSRELRWNAVLDTHPTIALHAFQCGLRDATSGEKQVLARHAQRAHSGRVRSLALRTLSELQVPDLPQLLPSAVFDRSAGVRGLAAWLMRQSGEQPELLWRKAIDERSQRHLAVAVSALAECAESMDAFRFEQVLAGSSPKLARQCVRGWVRAEGGASWSLLLATLAMDDRVIGRLFDAAGQQWQAHISAAQLEALWESGSLGDIPANRMRHVLATLPLWRRLQLLLDYLPPDSVQQDWHVQLIEDWLRGSRGFSPLDAPLRERLLRRLAGRPRAMAGELVARVEQAVLGASFR
ncbi:hypothetical protein [Stenotrophomonas humi]|uniref:hypothetical protein n=1 Tax=Stenotrophomonas humi TaxID=405444 RepID=UPI00128EDD27|nr:hypothetical protein [Stenotrophomonas humi]